LLILGRHKEKDPIAMQMEIAKLILAVGETAGINEVNDIEAAQARCVEIRIAEKHFSLAIPCAMINASSMSYRERRGPLDAPWANRMRHEFNQANGTKSIQTNGFCNDLS